MYAQRQSNSAIIARYQELTPKSAELAQQAKGLFPSGITHDSRAISPYGIYCTDGTGPRKHDVDGREYVDYFGGHGALILGHSHPKMVEAVVRQAGKGTHFGANHPLELEWGALVQKLIPSAERVRFTSSGTEATHLALRLARAYTGKTKLIRFRNNFHGWHDHMTSGYSSHYDGSPTVGVLPGVAENVVLLPLNDLDALAAALRSQPDIAAAFIEPTGASFGRIPVKREFLDGLRALTAEHGVLLVFDEVITGFRVSPGGAQAHYGIKPDLTTMAKILAGGLPGGAVAGRKDVLEMLDFEATKQSGREKIQHQGTFNANPLSAAAGVAVLTEVARGEVTKSANDYAARMRAALTDVIVEAGVPMAVYGEFSGFHIFTNPKGRAISPRAFDPFECEPDELKGTRPDLAQKLRLAMLCEGVDLAGWPGGMVSGVHGQAEFDHTVAAFARTLHLLKAEGEL